MKLEINEELYRYTYAEEMLFDASKNKVIYKPVTYIFDAYSFSICRNDSDEAKAADDPIVFPAIAGIEAQRAYVKALNNRKLNNAFKNLDDDAFSKTFWHYFDDGRQRLGDYREFEEYFRIKKIIDWCEENSIPYYLSEDLKWVLDYKEPHIFLD